MPVADFEAWRAACSVSRDAIERELGLPRECQDLNVAATLRVLAGPEGGERPARFAALLAQVDDAFAAWQGDDGANRVRRSRSGYTRLVEVDYDAENPIGPVYQIEFREIEHVDWGGMLPTLGVSVAGVPREPGSMHPDLEVDAQMRRIANDVESAVFEALTSSPKIPYTNAGIAMFAEAIRGAAEERGVLADVVVTPGPEAARPDRSVSVDFEARAATIDDVIVRGTVRV